MKEDKGESKLSLQADAAKRAKFTGMFAAARPSSAPLVDDGRGGWQGERGRERRSCSKQRLIMGRITSSAI